MMSNNKILTVSYGTFSCTLEGFEDSFDTMKAIAEYFRDLAQDDRYFGAEPPQPDAEMLARIAEREISRRVDAKADDEGIHLRASAAATAAITAASQNESAQPDATGAETVDPAQQYNAPEDDIEAMSAAQAEDTPTDVDDVTESADVSDSVISSLIEDENVQDSTVSLVGNIEQESPEREIEAVEDITAEVAPADESIFANADDADPIEETLNTDGFILDALAASSKKESDDSDDVSDNETVADAWEDDTPDDDIMADVAVDFEDEPETVLPATSSIAAKLQRIRAVVAKNRASTDGYSEDEHAEDFSKVEEPIVAFDAIQEDIDKAAAIDAYEFDNDADLDVETEQATLDNSDDDTHDELGALISQLGDDADTYEDADEEVFEAALDDSEIDDAPAFDEADFASLNEDDLEDAFDDGSDEDDTESLIASALTQEDDIIDEESMASRGRVISVKREDLEAALEESVSEESIFAEDESDAMSDSDLSDEDEDDLMRALAEVEAELPDLSLDDESDEDVSDLANILDGPVAGEEAELDRLMAEADSQMDEPESSSRRSAFNHLRAAVAATKADDKLTEEATSEEDDGAYRTDLAEAVKPRRPSVADADTYGQRPQTARPAPLKLVAEQRIDDTQKPEGPVSPRRVAAEAPEPAGQGGGFADYAETQGATELSDLLEAAASYLSFVEGRDQFSRPQLMTKVRQVGPEGFTREDGLRSFGQLLRSGKISKIKGGRFTVSDDIGFQPDQRAAG